MISTKTWPVFLLALASVSALATDARARGRPLLVNAMSAEGRNLAVGVGSAGTGLDSARCAAPCSRSTAGVDTVEATVIMTGQAMSDRSGDLTKSSTSKRAR
jgi:hypothetical protein